MRIISKFKDYYDSAQGYGLDPKLIYKRINSKVDTINIKALEKYKYQIHKTFYTKNKLAKGERSLSISVRNCLVCFCGKLYPVAITERYVEDNRHYVSYSYTQKDAKIALIKAGYNSNFRKERAIYQRRDWYRSNQSDVEFFNRRDSEELLQLCIDNKYLYFVLEGSKEIEMTLNPCLRDYGFQKIFGPYEAFQEISMFLGGVLGSEAAPMVQIEDKYIAAGHGFNKWSFKKMSTKWSK